jgi:hypothetical protein
MTSPPEPPPPEPPPSEPPPAGPLAPPPGGTLVLEATQAAASGIGIGRYGPGLAFANGEGDPRLAWRVELPAGLYEIWIDYAAAEERGTDLTIDDIVLLPRRAARAPTGGWHRPFCDWRFQCVVGLPGRSVTIGLHRKRTIPHVRAIALRPADGREMAPGREPDLPVALDLAWDAAGRRPTPADQETILAGHAIVDTPPSMRPQGHTPYRLFRARRRGDARPTGVWVQRRFQRLGNNVVQCLNAVAVASRIGARRVVAPAPLGLRLGQEGAAAGDLALHLTDAAPATSGDDTDWLAGGFFYPQGLEALYRGTSDAAFVSAARLVGQTLSQAEPSATGPQLVLHFRAGDVFARPGFVHPLYTQPPAAFYVAASLDARRRFGIAAARLVAEDNSNPAVEATAMELSRQGFEVDLASRSVDEDFRVLCTARYLVASFGTFVDMAALLSRHLACYWVFRYAGAGSGLARSAHTVLDRVRAILEAKDVEIVVLDDSTGRYPRRGAWVASPEQLALIRDLPLEAIVAAP